MSKAVVSVLCSYRHASRYGLGISKCSATVLSPSAFFFNLKLVSIKGTHTNKNCCLIQLYSKKKGSSQQPVFISLNLTATAGWIKLKIRMYYKSKIMNF